MSTCPSPASLEAFALGADAAGPIGDHIARCADCCAAAEEIRANQRFLDEEAHDLRAAIDAAPTAAAALPDDAVPGFELLEEISRGGQGIVYHAIQRSTKRAAAVKMLLGGAHATERQRARFDREIELAARLRHPSIASVFESGTTTDGHRYVAMEYVRGIPIDRYARERIPGGPGSRQWIDAVVGLFASIASGVGVAHTAGVIHRDLKPSNILVDDNGLPRVLDFGLAREAAAGAPWATSITATREFVGTPAYAAPEQLTGDPADVTARTDVYALGLTLYTTLTGLHPYPCDGRMPDVMRHIASTEPIPPSKHLPRIGADLETIILKALAKDPMRRYSSAHALSADLDHCLRGEAIDARRDSPWYVLRRLVMLHRTAAAAAALVLLTIVVAVIGLALVARDLDRERSAAVSALIDSHIYRARLLCAAGMQDEADSLLRDVTRRTGVDATDPNLCTSPEPVTRRIGWALMELASQMPRAMRVNLGAGVGVAHARFSPDGSEVIALGVDGSIGRWSRDGTPRALSPGCGHIINSRLEFCEFSADARSALVVEKTSVRLIDTAMWTTEAGPIPTTPRVRRFAYAPDGTFVVLQDSDRTVRVLDAALRPIRTLAAPKDLIEALALSSSGGLLAAATAAPPRAGMRLWRTDDWAELPTRFMTDLAPIGPDAATNSTAYLGYPRVSDDGRFIAAALGANIVLWQSDAPDAPITFVAHAATIRGLWFNDAATRLVSTSTDGEIAMWNLPDGAPAGRWSNGSPIRSIDCRPDIGALCAVDDNGSVSVYDLDRDAWLTQLPVDARGVCALAVSPGGQFIASGGPNGRIRIFDTTTRSMRDEFPAHDGVITGACFDPQGKHLFTVGIDGAVRRWPIDGEHIPVVIAEGLPGLWDVRATDDGRYLAACGINGTVVLWDRATGARTDLATDRHTRIPAVAFSPDGTMIAAVSTNTITYIWDTATGSPLHILSGHSFSARALAFSSDGSILATGADDRTIRLWDVHTGAAIRTISGLPRDMFELVFDPSGRILYGVGRGPELVVVDTETGGHLATFVRHEKSVFRVALAPDGRRIATGGEDRWINVWDLEHLGAYIRGNARSHTQTTP